MNWNKGFAASYYMTIIDPSTWRDIETIKITGGTISKTDEGLRESADVNCSSFYEQEKWIRIWLDARQSGSAAHEALFTGLATTPKNEIEGAARKVPLECYSVLKAAEDVWLQRGWYAPAGVDAGQLIKKLLSTTPAPLTIAPDAPSLSQAIIAEDNENCLTMSDKILDAINWRLRLNGRGEISVMPKATEPAAIFGAGNDVIEKTVSIETDSFSSPNVFRAVSGDMMAIARDESASSPFSTVSRGREVWAGDTNCDLNDGESIAQYAMRRLKEEQKNTKNVSYSRRFDPNVTPTDLVRIHYPAQGLTGVFYIKSDSIEIGGGARVTEEVSEWVPTS